MRQAAVSDPGATGHVRLPDGRMMTFSAAGPPDGFPIVYCHGAIGSPRWRTPALDRVLERLGLSYLIVNRPGFGGSDPSPGRTVIDFATDLGAVMTSLSHHRFSVVGVSAGAPYALACGCALGDRLECLAAVSPLVPATGAGASPGLRYRMPLLPFGSARSGPAAAELCLRALRLNCPAPASAMIEDYRVCRADWGFDPTEVRVPVAIWHGRADRLVPLAHVLALAAALSTSTTCVDPRGGHFFYSRRLTEIIGSLAPTGPTDTTRLLAA